MGAVGGLLGTAGGVQGTGIKGPGGVTLQSGLTPEQVQQANVASQSSLSGQQGLLAALQAQNGLGAQSYANVANQTLGGQTGQYNGAANQNAALLGQQGFNQQLGAANGIGTQNAAIAGLQGAAGQYADIAAGRGPNPAQAMLNQQTGQNVANQAALMAGQRGAGANVGLLARQAAQQGANTQQQAVGQAATMQANQQIAGLQGLVGAQQAIGGLGTTQAGMQQAGISQQGALAQQQVQNQLAANQAIANQANQMAGQQIAQTNANVAAAQNQQNMGLGALSNYNNANVSQQGNVNAANSSMANTTMQGQQGLIGSALQGLGIGGKVATGGPPAGARGGYVAMADGGDPMAPQPMGPTSSFGQLLVGAPAPIQSPGISFEAPPMNPGAKALKAAGAGPSSKDALKLALLAKGGKAEHDMRSGGKVKAATPAEKAVKPGNSYANDKIKALLSEGEVVLPRDVMSSQNPAQAAADFVSNIVAKKSGGVKSYAEGTPDEPVSEEDDAPVEAETLAPLDPNSPARADTSLAPAEPVAENPDQAPVAPAPVQAPAAPAAAKAPEAMAAPAPVQAPPKPTPVQMAQQMNQEDQKFSNDLAMGHIRPQTIQELYGKQDTIGKIGTLFGLLVAGAGAGLSHQPNAVMEMMNKEIERDFEAQKTNQTNKQNWYKLSLENQFNQARLQQMAAENINTLSTAGYTQAKTTLVPSELKEMEARTAGLRADTQLKADTHAKNLMTIGLMHELKDGANKMPPGPQRDAYLNAISQVEQAANQQMAERNLQTANKIEAVNALTGKAEENNSPINQERLDELNRKVALGDAAGVPAMVDGKVVTQRDLAKATEEVEQISRNRALYDIWKNSFQKLDKMVAAGKLNKAMRQAEVDLVAEEIIKNVSGGGVGAEKAKEMANAMFPDWKDWNGSRDAKWDSMTHQFEARESSAVTAKRLGVVNPFPKASRSAKKGPKYPEGARKNGSIVKNGRWVPDPASKQAKK